MSILGWTIPEARMFLRDLTEHATQRRFVYPHAWRPYDLVMWDNRATMHRARRFDRNEVRDVRPHHPRRRRADDRAGLVTGERRRDALRPSTERTDMGTADHQPHP